MLTVGTSLSRLLVNAQMTN